MVRQPTTGSPDVRRTNLAVLLGHLHATGPMRRAELTDLTGLNRSTVAGLVAELVALGLVEEETPLAGTAHAARGRPSPVVRPRAERVRVLAAEVAVGRVTMVLTGVGGSIVRRVSAPSGDGSPARVADVVQRLAAELGADAGGPVVGLGVAVPGVTRVADGNVRFAPNLGWRDAPLGDLVAERVPHVAVRVGNDGDLGVLAEHLRGVARGYDDVVFVEGETGVGCGVIIGGRRLIGAGGYAGELGHMSVRDGRGRRCRCGASGCWETEIGSEAIARALGLPADSPDDVLIAQLRAGGRQHADALEPVARYLGLGLGNVVNLLNPRLVVLGGLLREVYPLVADEIGRALRGSALAAPAEQVRLALPQLAGDAVLLGAAESVWQDLLSDPAAMVAA